MNDFLVVQRELFGRERRLQLGEGVAKESVPPAPLSGDASRNEIFTSLRRGRGTALTMPVQMLGGRVQPDGSCTAASSPDAQNRHDIFGSGARRLRLGGASALDETPTASEMPAMRRVRKARTSEVEASALPQTLGGHFDRKDAHVDERSRHKEIFGGRRELRSASPPSSFCDDGPMPSARNSWERSRSADYGRVDIFKTTRRKRGGDYTMPNQMQGSITAAERRGESDGGTAVRQFDVFGTQRRVRQPVEEVQITRCQSAEPRIDFGPEATHLPEVLSLEAGGTPRETPRETPRGTPLQTPRSSRPAGYSKAHQQMIFGRDWPGIAEISNAPEHVSEASDGPSARPTPRRSASADFKKPSVFEEGAAAVPRAGSASRMTTAEDEDPGRAGSTTLSALVSPRRWPVGRRVPGYSHRYRDNLTGSTLSAPACEAWGIPDPAAGSRGEANEGSWVDRDAAAIIALASARRNKKEPSWRSAVTEIQQKPMTQEAAIALQNFDQTALARERSLEGRLHRDRQEKIANLERSDQMKQKFSPKLLELRASEKALARSKDYGQAAVVKKQADAQEKAERAQHAAQHDRHVKQLQVGLAKKERAADSKLQKKLYQELWRQALAGHVPMPEKA